MKVKEHMKRIYSPLFSTKSLSIKIVLIASLTAYFLHNTDSAFMKRSEISARQISHLFTEKYDVVPLAADNATTTNATTMMPEEEEGEGVHLASWRGEYVSPMIQFTLFVLFIALVKIVFHHIPYVPLYIPESCILILVGVGVGAILNIIDTSENFRLYYRTFMLFLLPPIVLEAAYTLNDKAFSNNIGTILLYAVVGTTLNFILIGVALVGLGLTGVMDDPETYGTIETIEYLLFAALIVAVDPVAVLAIFQDIGVETALYFLVFGESLLNDAVTIVLYNMMNAFAQTDVITTSDYIIGILSFFTVSIGGMCVGILYGIGTCLITRITKYIRVTEPLAIYSMAYLSFLSAECVHWSGIISCVSCGIIQAHYAFHNISRKSRITCIYFIKMLASSNECVVFLFLGSELIRNDHIWNWPFLGISLGLCLVARLIGVYGLTFLVNLSTKPPVPKINFRDQFIMWYGGLRGAVAFALCTSLELKQKGLREMFLTATFVIIFFTVFVQGITVKPLVKACRIRQKDESDINIFVEHQQLMFAHLTNAMDYIVNQGFNKKWKMFWHDLNEKYVMRLLVSRSISDQYRFVEKYKAVMLKQYETMLTEGEAVQTVALNLKAILEADESLTADDILAEEIKKEMQERTPQSSRNRAFSTISNALVQYPSKRDISYTNKKDVQNLFKALSKMNLVVQAPVYDRDMKYASSHLDRMDIEELNEAIAQLPLATSASTYALNDGMARSVSRGQLISNRAERSKSMSTNKAATAVDVGGGGGGRQGVFRKGNQPPPLGKVEEGGKMHLRGVDNFAVELDASDFDLRVVTNERGNDDDDDDSNDQTSL